MSIVRGSAEPVLPTDDRGAIVTVGTFDGVHLGHREVLGEIVERARRTGRRSVLVTFHPHPLRIVRPEAAPPLLTTPAEKKLLLAESGIGYVVFLPFTRELQHYSARRFVEEILLRRLGMKELVIGYDHGFGRGREGGVETLQVLGEEHGFQVDVVGPVGAAEDPISSTRIRRAISQGDVVSAAAALGRPYSFQGLVVRGAGRGRDLGFPTANVRIDDADKLLPAEGVYAAFGLVDGTSIPGLLHLGPRPTFPGEPPTVELHLLDWSGDLYGREIVVQLCAYIRGISRFASVGELVAAMHEDERAGRAIFSGRAGSSACAAEDAALDSKA